MHPVALGDTSRIAAMTGLRLVVVGRCGPGASAVVLRPAAVVGVGRVVAQLGVLDQLAHRVDAEAVDAALEPEAQHVEHRLSHRRVAPVQVGLLAQVGVVVVLARAASNVQAGPPNTLSQLFGGPSVGARCTSRDSASRDERDSRTTDARSEVWLGTKSRISFMPRACAAATSASKSSSVPKSGSIAQ